MLLNMDTQECYECGISGFHETNLGPNIKVDDAALWLR